MYVATLSLCTNMYIRMRMCVCVKHATKKARNAKQVKNPYEKPIFFLWLDFYYIYIHSRMDSVFWCSCVGSTGRTINIHVQKYIYVYTYIYKTENVGYAEGRASWFPQVLMKTALNLSSENTQVHYSIYFIHTYICKLKYMYIVRYVSISKISV